MGIEVDTAGCNETPLRLSTDCTVLQEKGRYSACAPQIALEKVVAGEPTAFFPYVCVALHHYSDLKGRKSIEESILARCGIHEGDEGFMEEFSCAVSGELAYVVPLPRGGPHADAAPFADAEGMLQKSRRSVANVPGAPERTGGRFRADVHADEGSRLTKPCGTPTHMAPEVFARSRHPGYDHRADCFSLGVLLWALVCNRVPFGWAKRDIMDILLSVRDDPLPPGRSCVHFVTNLLNKVVQEATRDARVGCISSALGAEYDVQILASKLGQAGSHSQQRRHPGSCRVNISSLEVMTDKPDDGLKLAGQRCAVQARMRNVYSKEADVWQAAVDVAVPQVEDEALTSSRVWQVKGERLRVKSTLQE
ncbi:putative serine/threonine-protein kinase fhkC [Symbiodinium microadriaticum]|uniref:Putative serine/threonine-protein kinase fhkC n=1 Tax=Symbiodinium microadriaticum TaxID=2951 RepID=A0A1Q9DDG9_SYMMI|nr:putative serine/threonine-protein kinase fhkC [Symbiodinium microadriaticum]